MTSINSVHSSVYNQIFECGNKLRMRLRVHTNATENAYQCDICKKSFSVLARLTRHFRSHSGEKPYQCEYCGKSFSIKENLSVHRRIHTNERPYKCNICVRAFEHSGKLHRHMRVHTGERPYQCSECSKAFIQSGQLVIHMRTHTGHKPYLCKVCGKGFACSKQLKVHTRTHTGEKPYECNICGKCFGYNHVLKLHQISHFGEKFYKCTICHETFNLKKLMKLHLQLHSNSEFNYYMNEFESGYKIEQKMKEVAPYSHSFKTNSKVSLIKNSIDEQIIRVSEADIISATYITGHAGCLVDKKNQSDNQANVISYFSNAVKSMVNYSNLSNNSKATIQKNGSNENLVDEKTNDISLNHKTFCHCVSVTNLSSIALMNDKLWNSGVISEKFVSPSRMTAERLQQNAKSGVKLPIRHDVVHEVMSHNDNFMSSCNSTCIQWNFNSGEIQLPATNSILATPARNESNLIKRKLSNTSKCNSVIKYVSRR